MLIQGIPIAIEAKYMPDYGSFGIKNLTESQRTGLSDFQAAGGIAYVFLNIRRKPDKEAGAERMNRLLVFDWLELRGMTGNYNKAELLQRPYYKGAEGIVDVGNKFSKELGVANEINNKLRQTVDIDQETSEAHQQSVGIPNCQ